MGERIIGNTNCSGHLRFVGGEDSYFRVPSLTTTQRNALTAANGMEIYNTDTESREQYVDGAWVANNAMYLLVGSQLATSIPGGGIYDLDITLDKKGYRAGLFGWSGVSGSGEGVKGGCLLFGADNKFLGVEAAKPGPGTIYSQVWDSENQVSAQASNKWLNTGGTAWIKQLQLSTDGGTLEVDIQGTASHTFSIFYRIMVW